MTILLQVPFSSVKLQELLKAITALKSCILKEVLQLGYVEGVLFSRVNLTFTFNCKFHFIYYYLDIEFLIANMSRYESGDKI